MDEIANEMRAVEPKPTERIQDEIRETESEIVGTLHSIEERLTPAHIRSEAKDKMVHYAVVAYLRTVEAIKRRPIPAAAVGAGSLWLVYMLLKRRGSGEKREVTGAGTIERLPPKEGRHPVRTLRKYWATGKAIAAFGSALGAAFLQMKRREARSSSAREGTPAEILRAGSFRGAATGIPESEPLIK